MENQEKNSILYRHKLPLLSWLVIPILGLWLVTNYLIGLNRKVAWNNLNEQKPTVLSAQTENAPTREKLEWKGNGLVTLWFDDAWYSQYSIAFPILDKMGVLGTLAVPTSLVGGESYMTWPQIKRLSYKGWEIASHSVNHICDLEKLDTKTVESELGDSLSTLEEKGLSIENFVTPCGAENSEITRVAKDKYISLRTATEGLNSLPVDDAYSLKIHAIRTTTTFDDVKAWINEAEKSDSWLILVFHQIGYDGEEYETAPELFRNMMNLIEKSDLSVVLPLQALEVAIPN